MGHWVEKAPMPTPRHDLQSIAVGDKIYAISGADDLTVDVVEIYDTNTNTWTEGPPIPTARGWLGADILDNKIYVAGGKTIRTPEEKERTGIDYHFTSRDALEVLDLETHTWSKLQPMPGGVRAGVAVTACAGKIWVIGGNTMLPGNQYIVERVEAYDVQSGEWSTGPSLPIPLQGPTVSTVDERIYLTGGISDVDPDKPCRDEHYILDPNVGKWEPLAPVPTGRESSGVAVLGRKIYTFGGKDPHYSSATEIYDVDADTWFVDAPMPTNKAWLSAAAVGNRLFAMGGAHNEEGGGYRWIEELHEFVL